MSQDRRRYLLNNSTSKQQFAFSKDARFKDPRKPTKAFGYETKSVFRSQMSTGDGRAFGSSQDRFGYENVRFSKQNGKIDGPGTVDKRSNSYNKTFSFSFGVSRKDMKKIHVDEILRKKDENLPGPVNYEKKHLFGSDNGTQYSMRKKLMHFEQKLEKEKKLPGPGYYQDPSLTGVAVTNSRMPTSQSNAFSKSTDRFAMPKFQTPPPNNYETKQSLNQNFNSVHKYAGATKFGMNSKNYIDNQWGLEKEKAQPGPGNYVAFSEFAGPQ